MVIELRVFARLKRTWTTPPSSTSYFRVSKTVEDFIAAELGYFVNDALNDLLNKIYTSLKNSLENTNLCGKKIVTRVTLVEIQFGFLIELSCNSWSSVGLGDIEESSELACDFMQSSKCAMINSVQKASVV